MDEDIRSLIFQAIDETISQEDLDRLQDSIEHDAKVRQTYLKLVGLADSLDEIAAGTSLEATSERLTRTALPFDERYPRQLVWRLTASQFAIAAAVLILVAVGAFWLGRSNQPTRAAVAVTAEQPPGGRPESRIAGHATLRRAVELEWPQDDVRHREGDVLPNGPLTFSGGVAEIDFFCGATLIVEGPARLDIESDWSVRVAHGRLRAHVPPAARGFVVKAADSEIVDLGTEFAMEVSSENARVEVIDGEVKLRGGEHDGQHLVTGQGASLRGTLTDTAVIEGLSTVSDLSQQRREAEERRFRHWKASSQLLRSDERLIAYFPISEGLHDRVVPNVAPSSSGFDGQLVGPVEHAAGRFGPASVGLEFDRPGSRVRTRVDGEFEAFTFVCWARIDSLEHRYNALFMADGYENGEPHWQIRDDGSLMFSVMVDDTQEIEHFSEIDQKMVKQAGLHRVYATEPFWDISNSGQWFHLAAVYDPATRRVDQYVNSEQISGEEIIDKFHTSELHIGPAEIGNWGQPFRKTQWFAVRNLNGTIDELAIFNASLTADEIRHLYEQGKPIGY
jgi:hypothetical protein